MNPWKNRAIVSVRLALGLIFSIFGLNGFLHFLPQPPMSGPPADFAMALAATGYMFPLIKGTEVAAGVLLLANRWVPFALVVLAPVVVNIVLFHLFLAPAGLALPLVIVALGGFLAWSHRAVYAPLFRTNATQTALPSVRMGSHATTGA
jgi:hypothetical protein